MPGDSDPSTARTRSRDDVPALPARARGLARLARFMDSAIVLPGGYRIGWDGLIGLVPGIGDLVGLAVSGWIVIGTARLGVPRAVLLRMMSNVGIETLIGTVPILGDLFDLAFKANERNMDLAARALEDPVSTGRRSTVGVVLVALSVLGMIVLLGWAVVALAGALLGALGALF